MTIYVLIALIYSSVLQCNHIGISNHPRCVCVIFVGNSKFQYGMYKTSTNEAFHYHYKKIIVNYIQSFKKKWYTSLSILIFVFIKALVTRSRGSYNNRILSTQCILINILFFMFPRSVNFFLIEPKTNWPVIAFWTAFSFISNQVLTQWTNPKKTPLKNRIIFA